MTEQERRWARPASGRSLLVGVVVLVLVGLVLWLLAERNARQWSLVLDDGVLQVKKGILFPVGRQAFKTDDPLLAQAYAPLKPPPGAKLDEDRTFDDRAGLDQALYELLARWAREDIATERPDLVERALGWLGRADRLAGLSAAQREDLRALRAESGFFESRQLLERSVDALRQARERLRTTAGSASAHASDAAEVLRRIEPVLDEVDRAARVLAGSTRPPPRPAPTGEAAPARAGGASGTVEGPADAGVADAGPVPEASPAPEARPPSPADAGAPQGAGR
jgi:hypothetical protein